MPVQDGCRLTSPYTTARTLRGSTRPHSGSDFGGITPGRTSPIKAPADGVVFLAGGPALPGRSGPPLAMRHADGTATYWGHSRDMQVKVGQRVRRTDVLAETWHTGIPLAWGIHAHVENWADWRNHLTHRDPMPWLAANGWGTIRRDGATRLYDADAWWERHEGGRFAGQITSTRQAMLREHGFYGGILDGDRGPLTIAAEIAFLQNPPTIPALDATPEGDLTMADITAITTAIAELPAKFRAVLDSYRVDIHYTGGLRSVFLPAGITAISQNAARANLRAAELEKVVEVIANKVGLDPDVIREAAKQGASEALAEGLDVEATVNIARKEG